MKHLTKPNIRKWPTERISQRVLYLLTGIAAVVFALFYLVGYNTPSDDVPGFNAPLFTNAVIILMWLLLILACVVTVCSAEKAVKASSKKDETQNGIPTRRIAYGIAGGTVALLVLTFLLGSGSTMAINGVQYKEVFWLKATDMFINTSLALIAVAVVAVIYGATRYNRKRKGGA